MGPCRRPRHPKSKQSVPAAHFERQLSRGLNGRRTEISDGLLLLRFLIWGDGAGRRFVRGSGDVDLADDPSNVIVASSPTILIGDCLAQAYVTAEKHEGSPCAAEALLSALSQRRCRKYRFAPARRNRRNDSTSFGRNVSHPLLPTFRRDRKIAT